MSVVDNHCYCAVIKGELAERLGIDNNLVLFAIYDSQRRYEIQGTMTRIDYSNLHNGISSKTSTLVLHPVPDRARKRVEEYLLVII